MGALRPPSRAPPPDHELAVGAVRGKQEWGAAPRVPARTRAGSLLDDHGSPTITGLLDGKRDRRAICDSTVDLTLQMEMVVNQNPNRSCKRLQGERNRPVDRSDRQPCNDPQGGRGSMWRRGPGGGYRQAMVPGPVRPRDPRPQEQPRARAMGRAPWAWGSAPRGARRRYPARQGSHPERRRFDCDGNISEQ